MALQDERKFVTFRRGKVRDDVILGRFRNSIRSKTNPDTGKTFTEDEIAIITQEDSRFYIEADAIDLYGQAIQQRAIWFADQIRPERASSTFLKNYHGELWLPDGFLPATGGSGSVSTTGSPGTIYTGSTTIGDPTASIARDPSGKRYQVLFTEYADALGEAIVQLKGIDVGDSTNVPANTVFTWINPPLGTNPEAISISDFSGGFNRETENEFALRIRKRIGNVPGSGNNPQFRVWASQSSNAVQDAFIYSTAFHAGSTIVAISQKRGNSVGPLARIASIGTLTSTTSYLVPPSSPVVPHGVHVLVTTIQSEPTDMSMKLSMPIGSSGGWADTYPWPLISNSTLSGIVIDTVYSQTNFRITTDVPLPTAPTPGSVVYGTDAPAIMIWLQSTSRFEPLDIYSITNNALGAYTIRLNTAPSQTIMTGNVISPLNNRHLTIARSVEQYFDSLGPSELIPNTDVRYIRAARYPRPDKEQPYRAGQNIIASLDDTLGGALTGAEVVYISKTTPTVPTEFSIINGPNFLTLGNFGIYPLL